jgi:hypothetical protein
MAVVLLKGPQMIPRRIVWTFDRRARGLYLGAAVVVPDQVAADPSSFAVEGRSFHVLALSGARIRVVLARLPHRSDVGLPCMSYSAHRRALGLDYYRPRPRPAVPVSRASVPSTSGALALPRGFFQPAP